MIIRRLIWDEWNIEHIARHNVEPEEVEEVCKSKNLFNKWKNKTYRVIGQTEDGRYLTIFLAPRIGQSYYPVTARDATERERKVFRRK
ncbi:MAG: BrnT family toxin [Candidatus Daviesbacteria bacterium]|nr:BrnT family toxin [Candidatus Daviesbacteria bacterium]